MTRDPSSVASDALSPELRKTVETVRGALTQTYHFPKGAIGLSALALIEQRLMEYERVVQYEQMWQASEVEALRSFIKRCDHTTVGLYVKRFDVLAQRIETLTRERDELAKRVERSLNWKQYDAALTARAERAEAQRDKAVEALRKITTIEVEVEAAVAIARRVLAEIEGGVDVSE